MASNLIVGDDGANTLQGGADGDLIYGFDPDDYGFDPDGSPQDQVASITATRVAAGLSNALFATAPTGDLERLFIVEKVGRIKILDLNTGQVLPTPFIDLTAQVSSTGEEGLLGLAFDPDFQNNGVFYVHLSNLNSDSEIRRYQVSASNPNQADPASAQPVITIVQHPGTHGHRAGWLGFGPDGYLYTNLGDGGTSNFSQDINSFRGKVLRLDVSGDDFPADPTRNYAIPDDNPFVNAAGADEIFALGLRNPWRASFDRGLGTHFIGDVGAAKWEEINLGQAGANYGWNNFEGPEPFIPGTPTNGTLTSAIFLYPHDGSGKSITGGYVYRGGESEAFQGRYFFADFVTGQLFTLHSDGNTWEAVERTAQVTPNVGTINSPASFGEDGRGNLYLVDFGGEVFRLTPQVVSGDTGDQLFGFGGDDLLFGGSGDDTLDGGTESDALAGGAGNDTMIVTSGHDTADGASGIDRLIVDFSAGALGFSGGVTGGTLAAGYTGTLSDKADTSVAFSGIESFSITTGSGNDTIKAGAGNDTINGGPGNDTIDFSAAVQAIVVDLSADATQATGADIGTDQIDNIENVIGGAGNDVIRGTGSANVLNGGAGIDTVSYETGARRVTADLYANMARDGAVLDTLLNIENVTGSALADAISGNAAANVLDGLGGIDTVSYYKHVRGVTISLAGSTGYDGLVTDTLLNFEHANGSGFNDTISGNDGVNRLDGLGGIDTVSYAAAGHRVVVDLQANMALDGVVTDTLFNFENATGSAFNDAIAGNNAANVLDGLGGTDTVSYFRNSHAVTVSLVNGTASDGVVTDTLINFENVNGSGHGDTITGNSAANILDGLSGIDVLTGGDAHDTFVFNRGQANGDTVVDFAGNDAAAGDQMRFVGYGPGATFNRVGTTNTWDLSYNGGINHEFITFSNGASIHDSDYVFL